MRTPSIPSFDLRDAVDGIRDAFGPGPRGAGGERTKERDIRAAILLELSDQPMHGYQLISAIAARSGGTWTPTAGSVYPTLQLLTDEELVTVAQVGERKVYTLTAAGRIAAADAGKTDNEPRAARPGQPGQSTLDLTKSGMKLASALSQVARTGTPEQSERAVALIDEARRKVYAILAED
jgi:DNA-binding PadR family transcriptional regulator